MTVDIQRPSTLDVTKNNPNEVLYIVGDATTDESWRIRTEGTHPNNLLNFEHFETLDETDIDLSDTKVETIEATSTITEDNPFFAGVLTDTRTDNTTPAGISGSMVGRVIHFDGTLWKSTDDEWVVKGVFENSFFSDRGIFQRMNVIDTDPDDNTVYPPTPSSGTTIGARNTESDGTGVEMLSLTNQASFFGMIPVLIHGPSEGAIDQLIGILVDNTVVSSPYDPLHIGGATYTLREVVIDQGQRYLANTAGEQTGSFQDNILLWDIDLPITVDVTQDNTISLMYVTGNETTDGSVRFIFDTDESITTIEARADGVWNDTDMRFNAQSVLIGRDLKIEAAGDFIKTVNPSGFSIHSKALIPHIPFTSSGTLFPHTPIADSMATTVIFGTAVSETTSTILSQAFTLDDSQIINSLIYEVGTTGASADVEHTVYEGSDNTGTIISRMNFPSSSFTASTTATIDVDSSIGLSNMHTSIFVEITSDTAFSLVTDASSNLLMSIDSQTLETRDLLYDDLIYDSSLGLVLTSDLNPIYGNQF